MHIEKHSLKESMDFTRPKTMDKKKSSFINYQKKFTVYFIMLDIWKFVVHIILFLMVFLLTKTHVKARNN